MTMKPRLLPLVMATCTCFSTSAHALQLVEARDGVSVEAIISIKEPTRIRIENAKITEVMRESAETRPRLRVSPVRTVDGGSLSRGRYWQPLSKHGQD